MLKKSYSLFFQIKLLVILAVILLSGVCFSSEKKDKLNEKQGLSLKLDWNSAYSLGVGAKATMVPFAVDFTWFFNANEFKESGSNSSGRTYEMDSS